MLVRDKYYSLLGSFMSYAQKWRVMNAHPDLQLIYLDKSAATYTAKIKSDAWFWEKGIN